MVHKIVGALLQASGGLLILYSINENLGLFRRKSLLAAVVAWFKSFPRKGKNITLHLGGAYTAEGPGGFSVSTSKAPMTLQERVEYLEAALAKHRQDVEEEFANVQRSLTELHSRVVTSVGQLVELSEKVEQAAVGAFKLQGFGVLLALYGAITSVFA
jgi:hypothetical protein